MSNALEIVQDSPADLVNSLKARLASTDDEKKAALARFKEIDDEIRIMLKNAPNRDELPRGSDGDKLKKDMKDLETKRNTTSMTLNQEKQIIKELEQGQKQLKLLKKYEAFNEKITELKAARQEADDIYKNKKHTSGDMKSGLAKLEISGKLNMEPTEIKTEIFEFPGEFIGRVIGKKGAGKQLIEDQCNVELSVDAKAADEEGGMAKAKIMGSDEGIKKCIEILTTIAESVKEEFNFGSDKQFSLMLRNKGELLKKCQEDFVCRIDLMKDEDKKPTGKMTIEGLPHNTKKCIDFMKKQTGGFQSMAVEDKQLPALIGSKGVTIRAIQDDSGTVIDIIRDSNTLEIRGSKAAVASAVTAINAILLENKEISCDVRVDKEYIPAIVGTKGATIQAMQKDSGFAKFDIIKDDPDRPVIRIRGRKEQMEKGKELLMECIADIEKCYRKMPCPEALMPVIIGKAGANIKKLQEDSGCPRISYDKDSGCLKIKCEEGDFAALDKAEELIKVIMKENEITEIKISQTMINALLNKKGEQINLIAAETELRINVNKESGKLVMKGTEEAVSKAKSMLAELELVNQEDEVPVSDGDFALIIGSGGKTIQGMQADSGCNMDISKDTNSIKLRGTDDAIKKGRALIDAILNGGEDGLTAVIEGVAQEAMGACVGKGGSVIKKLQEENSVKLDLLRDRGAIRIRGENKEGVAKCVEEVEKILIGVKVTCIIPVRAKPANDKWALMLDIGRESDVSVQYKEDFTQGGGKRGGPKKKAKGSDSDSDSDSDEEEPEPKGQTVIMIRGTANAAPDVKDRIASLLKGVWAATMNLESDMFKVMSESEIEKITYKTKADIECNELNKKVIVSSRNKEAVKLAVDAVEMLLVFHYPDRVGREVVPAGAIAAFLQKGKAASRKIEQATGLTLTLDSTTDMIRMMGTAEGIAKAKPLIQEVCEQWAKENAVVTLHNGMVSIIIGKKGASINKLCDDTGANIKIDSAGGVCKISGSEENVQKAVETIEALKEKWIKENKVITVDPDIVGTLIGKAGCVIKALSEESGCQIDIDSQGGMVKLRGDPEKIAAAEKLIMAKLEENKIVKMEIHPGDFKIIIGPKGETIRTIQTDSGCNIDTDRDTNMIAFRGTEEQCAKGKELVEKLLEPETAAREKRAEEDRLWHEEENKKWKEEKAAAKAARAAAGLDEEEEEEDKKDEEEGGHGASLSQFAVNPLGGTGNYAVNSPRSKSAAKRARKKAGGKTGGPTNIDDMSDEQVLNLLLGSDTKRAEAAKAKLLEKKEKEEKEKAAKKAAAKKAFEAKEKAEEAARQAEFKKINAKYAMRL